jgi:hypothetical protein
VQRDTLELDESYLAGIWQKDVLRSLSWYRHLDDVRSQSLTILHPIEEIFAPSCSWASVVAEKCAGTAWKDRSLLLPEISPASLVSYSITPMFSDTTGRVKQANITIDALCRSVSLEVRHQKQSHPVGQYPGILIFTVHGFEPAYLNQWVRGYIDHPNWLLSQLHPKDSPRIDLNLECLLLSAWRNEHDGITECHCLLLHRVGENGCTYERYGLLAMKFDSKRWNEHKSINEGWNHKRVIMI